MSYTKYNLSGCGTTSGALTFGGSVTSSSDYVNTTELFNGSI